MAFHEKNYHTFSFISRSSLFLQTYKAELDSTKEDNLKMEKIKDDLKDQLKLENDVLKAKNIEVTDLEKYKIGLEKQLDKYA